MSHDVFISHSSQDDKACKVVCKALETRGISCWVDHRDVPPGVAYAIALEDAIDQSEVFVVILTQESMASPHITSEVERAFSTSKAILPMLLEDVAIPAGGVLRQ